MDLIAILFGTSIIGLIGAWAKWVISIGGPLVLLLIYRGVRIQAKTYQNNIPKSLKARIYGSMLKKDGEPSSYFWGKWFIGSIADGEEGQGGTVHLICTEAMFESLMSNEREEEEDCGKFDMKSLRVDQDKYKIVTISGHYLHRRVEEVSSDPIDAEPRGNQQSIIKSIMSLRKKSQVIMITGNPGSGKTFIAHLLIKAILQNPTGCFEGVSEVRYCKTFKPSEPNTFFSHLYNKVRPSKTKRLIILLNEIDVLLDKIHRNDLPSNQKFPREVFDKTSWNDFLDDFDYCQWKWATIIMTSNRSRSQIDAMDPSFLRAGRVDQWHAI